MFFFGVRVREEAGATNTLPALVLRLREALEADDAALSQYESALHQAGYSPLHEDEYAKTRLRVIEERLFSVTGDFPRLTPQAVSGGLSTAIERVEYEINLNTFDHLCVARTPAEAGQHLQ